MFFFSMTEYYGTFVHLFWKVQYLMNPQHMEKKGERERKNEFAEN